MALVNEHFLKLPENSLFADLDKKINSFKITHHQAELIYLNRNDAVCPIPPAASAALHKAVDELCKAETFKGYSPIQGYDFLIDTILKHDYQARGISFSPTEIFINDGSKSDIGNFGDILRHDNSIGVTDSSYPFYIDSNAMCGRAGCIQPEDGKWSNVVYIPCDNEKGFIPQLPGCRVDIIYLSNPIFPTGALLTKQELKKWVNYALENDTLILYDAAFEPFIQHPDIPHSIFEIKGARKVAIEFKSYSKAAGFSGIRCGYTVVPKEVSAAKLTGERKQLNSMWRRRQEIKFNGASYMAQRSRSPIYARRKRADESMHQLLPRKHPHHDRGLPGIRTYLSQQPEFSVRMDKNTIRQEFLEVFRRNSIQHLRSMYTRCIIWSGRRRIHPTVSLLHTRSVCRSDEASRQRLDLKEQTI